MNREAILLKSVLDHVLDGIITIDERGTIQSINPAAEHIFGYTQDEVLGQNLRMLMPEPYYGEHDGYLSNYMRTGVAKIIGIGREVSGRRKDGSTFAMELAISEFELEGQRYFTGIVRDVTQQRKRELLLHSVLDHVLDGIISIDSQGSVQSLNSAAEHIFGYTQQEVLGQNVKMLMPEPYQGEHDGYLKNYLRGGEAKIIGIGREVVGQRKDGTTFPMDLAVSEFNLGRERYFTGIVRDITQRKKLEDQLRQSQKMEAVGKLAGGMAHDFNNLLMIIMGYCELMKGRLPIDSPLRSPLIEVEHAGERAALLTRQLLAFSRQQVLEPRVLDLNEVIVETERMLSRVIGEDINIELLLEPLLGRVRVDPGQVSQVLINLAVNARDAMPRGGTLTIRTANVDLFGDRPGLLPEARLGRHVVLSIRDTGTGMSREVQDRVFEPFFTTKPLGEGTGLGLATVYGIVTQSDGALELESQLGVGTVFRIYLPVVEEPLTWPVTKEMNIPARGQETILLVEDEEAVRRMAILALESYGYHVLKASNGAEALELAAAYPEQISILVTDVVMPLMSGRELAELLLAVRPGLKVLFMSGYTDDAVLRHGLLHAEVAFMQKPFPPTALARRVREILEQG